MQQVNVAWNTLSDVDKKREYDKRVTPRAQVREAEPRMRAQPAARASSGPVHATAPSGSAGRAIDEQEGDGSVSIWASIPVLLIVGLLLGVLIITAFADREPSDNRPVIERNAADLSVGDCFVLDAGIPRARSCTNGAAEGIVIEVGPDRGNCPSDSFSIKDPNSELFLCWARMIPGSTNTTP